jgi:hypothetical protein
VVVEKLERDIKKLTKKQRMDIVSSFPPSLSVVSVLIEPSVDQV